MLYLSVRNWLFLFPEEVPVIYVFLILAILAIAAYQIFWNPVRAIMFFARIGVFIAVLLALLWILGFAVSQGWLR